MLEIDREVEEDDRIKPGTATARETAGRLGNAGAVEVTAETMDGEQITTTS